MSKLTVHVRRGSGAVLMSLALVPIATAQRLPVTKITTVDGLPSNTVHRIVPDSRGYLWFCTSEGLSRYDGVRFHNYSLGEGLPGLSVGDLLELPDGTYWIAVEGGPCRFDPQSRGKILTCFPVPRGTTQEGIHALLDDGRGQIWCASDSGVFRRPANALEKGWKRVEEIGATAARLWPAGHALLRDSRGDIWVGAFSGLYRFRSDRRVDHWTQTDGISGDAVRGLYEGPPGTMWIAAEQGLTQLTVDSGSGDVFITHVFHRARGLASDFVWAARQWKGDLWIATFQGLNRRSRGGLFEEFTREHGLPALSVECLAEDQAGNLWFGTDGGGAIGISRLDLANFAVRDGLASSQVAAILEDNKGVLTVITKTEHDYSLNRFDGRRFHASRPSLPRGVLFGWGWNQIGFQTRGGEWWLASAPGVFRFRSSLHSAPVLYTATHGLTPGNVFRLWQDKADRVWVSTSGATGHGLSIWDRTTGRFRSFDESDGLPLLKVEANLPSALAEDQAGNVWIGLLQGGLLRYRNDRFEMTTSSTGAPDRGVRALHCDRLGRLWVGTSRQGLLRIDEPASASPKFTAYTTADGLSSNTIATIGEDAAGRLYIGSSRGIDLFDSDGRRIRHLSPADGLISGEIRVAFCDRSNHLWFGSDQGLSRLDASVDSSLPPSPVVIHALRVNGVPLPLSPLGETDIGELNLSSSQRQIQVEFAGFGSALRYQTFLSGIDRDWTVPSPASSVHYVSLAPGAHELRIRAITPDGIPSPRPARLRFRIATPVWRRWWFLALAALAGMISTYIAHRWRLQRLLEVERVRTRIATDLHDDIGTGLSQIALLGELAQRSSAHPPVDSAPAPGQESLARIVALSREMVESMSDIVWAINPARDRLSDLTYRMRRFGADQVASREIRFDFQGPSNAVDHQLSSGVRREIFLIFKESIYNAVRHSRCSAVEVEFRVEHGRLMLRVSDNGTGFVQPAHTAGHGLPSMRSRAERLGGRLEILSGGDGTSVCLLVPLSTRRHRNRW